MYLPITNTTVGRYIKMKVKQALCIVTNTDIAVYSMSLSLFTLSINHNNNNTANATLSFNLTLTKKALLLTLSVKRSLGFKNIYKDPERYKSNISPWSIKSNLNVYVLWKKPFFPLLQLAYREFLWSLLVILLAFYV